MQKEAPARAMEGTKEFQVEARAITRTKDKVCIVGCADSKKLVPFDDDSFEFWGVNNLYGVNLPGAHWDRWFEIHNIEIGQDGKYRRRESLDFRGQNVQDYLEGIGKMDCPVVYMQKKWDIIPQSVEYPLEAICSIFGRYITNTISYEIALAILMGFKEIHVYGVDMAVGCLAPETRVLTADLRWIPCGEVEVGDQLMGFDEEPYNGNGKTRRWRVATVTANPEITKPCYRIVFDDGTQIVASEKHGWLTHGENLNRWKTTDQLVTSAHRPGRPTKIVKLLNTWGSDTSWEDGYIPNIIGEIQAKNNVAIIATEFIGEQTVMGLETDTKTYIAEGFASHNSEYQHQRPSCEYFLGIATGKGMTVFIPDEADLLKTRFLYGFEEPKRAAWQNKVKMIDKDMAKKQAAAEAQMEQLKTAVNQYIGARFAVGELNKIWGNLDDE